MKKLQINGKTYKVLINGNLIAPKGEQPPVGYEVDPAYRNQFTPLLEECPHRTVEQVFQSCCNNYVTRWGCDLIPKPINKGVCKDCQGDMEWLKEYIKKFG